jgi:hypothetical protein
VARKSLGTTGLDDLTYNMIRSKYTSHGHHVIIFQFYNNYILNISHHTKFHEPTLNDASNVCMAAMLVSLMAVNKYQAL